MVSSFHKIRDLVRRCLNGELERLSILDSLGQEADISFAEDNFRFDQYGLNVWKGGDLSCRVEDENCLVEEDLEADPGVGDRMEMGNDFASSSSLSLPINSQFSRLDFLEISSSFGFVFRSDEEFCSAFLRFEGDVKGKSLVL